MSTWYQRDGEAVSHSVDRNRMADFFVPLFLTQICNLSVRVLVLIKPKRQARSPVEAVEHTFHCETLVLD